MKQKKTMINIINKYKILYFVIFLIFSPLLAHSTNNECISEKIRKKLILLPQWDGIFYYMLVLESNGEINLIHTPQIDSENYLLLFSQIRKILIENYSCCEIKLNTILKIKIDTTQGFIKVEIDSQKNKDK